MEVENGQLLCYLCTACFITFLNVSEFYRNANVDHDEVHLGGRGGGDVQDCSPVRASPPSDWTCFSIFDLFTPFLPPGHLGTGNASPFLTLPTGLFPNQPTFFVASPDRNSFTIHSEFWFDSSFPSPSQFLSHFHLDRCPSFNISPT